MGTLSRSEETVTCSIVGLMVLREHFEQRKVEATFSSFRSMVPLTTPSGPQYVESELEAELLEQLAFSPGVYDLLTQPIIEYTVDGKARRYTPDMAVQLYAGGDYSPCRYLVEVKRREDLIANASKYAVKFEAGRMAAEEWNAAFRILDEKQIRTPYLNNTRLLHRHFHDDPELIAVDIMRSELDYSPISVTQTIELLRKHGVQEPDARASIEQSVAWRMILCDLSRPFNDETLITARHPGRVPERNSDPILRALYIANSA